MGIREAPVKVYKSLEHATIYTPSLGGNTRPIMRLLTSNSGIGSGRFSYGKTLVLTTPLL